jgi:branched-chain amino acid transport system permease protein
VEAVWINQHRSWFRGGWLIMTNLNLKNNKNIIKDVILLVLAIIGLILPKFLTSPYTLQIFILIFLYAGAAGAWNIIGGYGGQISLGHVAFFGIGAYATTLLYLHFALSPWLGMIIGGVLAAVIACLISYPCFRLRGPFFTLATLAFAEVLRLLCIWARPLTGGQVGLTVLYKPCFAHMQFPGKTPYYYISFVLMLVILGISIYIERTKFGYYLTALKEDHDAAEALGVNTARYKLYATGISGFLTAICGAFFGQLLLYLEPASVFSSALSNQFAMIAVVGGAGTALGPILGSFIVTPLNELLRGALGGSFQGLNYVIFGLLLILVVTYMPNGLVGFYKEHIAQKFKK